MFQITVMSEGVKVGECTAEISGTAAEREEQALQLVKRVGRVLLENSLPECGDALAAPTCCQRKMESCSHEVITVHSTCGDVPVSRRVYRCKTCGHRCIPGDAELCCGKHRVTKPLAKRPSVP